MSGNLNVTSIVNKVQFKIDQNSYNKSLKAIRKLASEWARITSKFGGGGPWGGGGRGGRGGWGANGPEPFRPSAATRRREAAEARARAAEQRRNDRNANTIASGAIGRDPKFLRAYASQIGVLNQQLRAGVITTSQYNKQLASMSRNFRNSQAGARGLGGAMSDIRGDFVAMTASYTAFAGLTSIMRTGQMFQSIDAGMTMASGGDAKNTVEQIQYIRNEAQRLGLDLKVAAQGFTQMSVAGAEIMDKQGMQGLFTGLSEYATALGVDTFRYEKSILAIGQMLN